MPASTPLPRRHLPRRRPARRLGGAAALALTGALTLTGCGLWPAMPEDPEPIAGARPTGTASLTAPSGSATPSAAPDASESPEDEASKFAEKYGKQIEAGIVEAQKVAERVAVAYGTWSWREDKQWDDWMARMRRDVTEAFEHETEELFSGGDSWRALVVSAELAQRSEVVDVDLLREETPTLYAVSFLVTTAVEQAVSNEDFEEMPARRYRLVVQRADVGKPWKVALLTAP